MEVHNNSVASLPSPAMISMLSARLCMTYSPAAPHFVGLHPPSFNNCWIRRFFLPPLRSGEKN